MGLGLRVEVRTQFLWLQWTASCGVPLVRHGCNHIHDLWTSSSLIGQQRKRPLLSLRSWSKRGWRDPEHAFGGMNISWRYIWIIWTLLWGQTSKQKERSRKPREAFEFCSFQSWRDFFFRSSKAIIGNLCQTELLWELSKLAWFDSFYFTLTWGDNGKWSNSTM